MLVARQATILWPWRRIKIFLNPLITHPVRKAPKKQRLHEGPSRVGDEEPIFDISKIVARNRYYK
jgi:hypothetical protein